ncbi:PEP-CTERM sorting domain-containing protein [Glaciimonas sp. CA11.2]|uniref:PEP-CTERM sorting domain-containing protein n=1 Tax=Glaciimonas sp. CA11.2 TaxID=3048601 RepID=UPI002AB387F8|nr:PEP-CTERM sorting domain-containing protein [Glaciimonas sp. CA11.2]MDY7547257.1 PEP-CTERM sorting domain-containing protein [Glaciimonas sp. CA11.2]
MKTVLQFTLLATVIAASSAAHATLVTYDFTDTITSMFEYNGTTKAITNVTSSSMSGVAFSNGDTAHGTFSYDTATVLSPYYQPPAQAQGSYVLYYGPMSSTLTFDKSMFVYNSVSDGLIQVADNASSFSGWDVFYLGTGAAYSPLTFQSMTLNLFDSSGQVFSSAAVPRTLPLSGFSYADVDYTWLRQSDGSQMHISSKITSLEMEPSLPVPEPGTYTLLLGGLGLMGFMGRRRKFS